MGAWTESDFVLFTQEFSFRSRSGLGAVWAGLFRKYAEDIGLFKWGEGRKGAGSGRKPGLIFLLICFEDMPMRPLVVNSEITKQLNWFVPIAMKNRVTLATATLNITMIPHSNKLMVLSLLAALAGGMTTAVQADETPVEKPADKTAIKKPMPPTQQKLSGKVVAVDKAAKTVTLQINGQTYVLQISEATKIAQSGKQKSLTDVTVGEDVTVDVMLRETVGGRIEVSVLSVELPETATAQGGAGKSGGFRPFQTEPNPAHIDGSVVSPTKPGKK